MCDIVARTLISIQQLVLTSFNTALLLKVGLRHQNICQTRNLNPSGSAWIHSHELICSALSLRSCWLTVLLLPDDLFPLCHELYSASVDINFGIQELR